MTPEVRNFGVSAVHPVYRSECFPFRGTLVEVKREAQRLLDRQEGNGWKAIAVTDGLTVYCTYWKTEELEDALRARGVQS